MISIRQISDSSSVLAEMFTWTMLMIGGLQRVLIWMGVYLLELEDEHDVVPGL